MSQKRPGRVVQIRLNPKDCMSAIDLWDKLQITIEGVSFAQVVSTALNSSLETFRRNGILPERQGFEYSEMMARFPDSAHRSRTLQINEAMYKAGTVPAVLPESLEVRREKSRYKELRVKALHASESMTSQEVLEYSDLSAKYFTDE